MRVIDPLEISDTELLSSTVLEGPAADYDSNTTYADGDLVGTASAYSEPQEVWESLQDGNTGNAQEEGAFWTSRGIVYREYDDSLHADLNGIVSDLATHSLYQSLEANNHDIPLSDVTKWRYIGKTNRFKLFDYSRNDITTAPESIQVVIKPGRRINSLTAKGVQANAYSLSVTSVFGGGEVYSASGSLNLRTTSTWAQYFYGEFDTSKSLVFFDLPLYSDAIITLTLTVTSGSASIATAVVGTFMDIGETLTNARNDIMNFSTVTRDAEGNAILVPTRNIPKSKQQVLAEKADITDIIQLRDRLNGRPAIWYGLSDPLDGYFEAVAILGFYRNFEIELSEGGRSIINLELEEV